MRQGHYKETSSPHLDIGANETRIGGWLKWLELCGGVASCGTVLKGWIDSNILKNNLCSNICTVVYFNMYYVIE